MDLQNQFEKEGSFLFRYRSFLPIVLLVPGVALYVYQVVFMQETRQTIGLYEFVCLFIALLGLGIRVYTLGYVAPKTSGRNTTQQIANSLNTTGIYSMVRHPLYLGNFFMWLGVVLFIGNFWFTLTFALVYWIYYERIMYAEEQFLKRKFSDEYIKWAKETPAFIPNFYRFKASKKYFNWHKVFIQEKNGLLAIFIIIASLEIFEMLWSKEPHFDGDEYIFTIGLILSFTFYCLFKIIKIKERRQNHMS